MALLAFEFLFRILFGWNFFLLFISRAESSEKFLKVSARFSWGFGMVALLAAYSAELGLRDTLPVILLLFSTLAYLSRAYLALRLASVTIILLSPLLLLHRYPLLTVANTVLSAWALGGILVAQFLGHWYLNVPNIHIREFKRIANMSLVAILLRTLGVIVACVFWRQISASGEGLLSGEFFSISGDYWNGMGAFGVILFAARVLWGIAAPLLLTWMAKKTVDMRSTQSATGIFYANSVLMLLGELCALYLEKELRWPI